MAITARGATDAANIVLFWPHNLPDDADETLRGDPIDLIERLANEGKLIWFPCDGDGEYSVAIYVRSDVRPDLSVLCKDEEKRAPLIVRGTTLAAGNICSSATARCWTSTPE